MSLFHRLFGLDRSIVLAFAAARVDGLGDGFEEQLAEHGFEEVRRAAGLLSLLANPRRIMRGDKDDWHQGADLAKPTLQIQAGHAAELHVEHQTVRVRERPRSEESLGRGIRVGSKSRGSEQPSKSARKTVIVIHDRDIDFVLVHPGRTR
jgi:hypothetical protein